MGTMGNATQQRRNSNKKSTNGLDDAGSTLRQAQAAMGSDPYDGDLAIEVVQLRDILQQVRMD